MRAIASWNRVKQLQVIVASTSVNVCVKHIAERELREALATRQVKEVVRVNRYGKEVIHYVQ